MILRQQLQIHKPFLMSYSRIRRRDIDLVSISKVRYYAHIGSSEGHCQGGHDELDPESIQLLNSFPQHTNPTPYEVLQISYHSFDERALKQNFNKFAKLYHPDIKLSHPLLETSDVHRGDRFQTVLSAYKLLKNKKSKMMYDHYKIGWNDNNNNGRVDTVNNNMNKYHPNVKHYQYYSAGTWEDYQHMKNGTGYTSSGSDRSWSGHKNMAEELKKNRFQIVTSVIAVMVFAFIVESISINELQDQETILRANLTKRSKQDLQKAYENYGMGHDKDARIQRFLWWRQISDILFSG